MDIKKLGLMGAMVIALSASVQAVPLWMNMGSGNTYVADHITVSNVGLNTSDAAGASYFSFVLTPESGFQINFADFSFLIGASGSLPTNVAFLSSLDGFGNKIGPVTLGAPVSLESSLFQGITRPIEFRLYGFDTLDGASGISQFAFHGGVSPSLPAPVPESTPGLIAFGAAVGLLAAARSRFRAIA
jgi:hypothetical protein